MSSVRTMLACLALAGLGLAGCGGGGQAAEETIGKVPTSSQTTAPTATPPPERAGGVVNVTIPGISYSPETVTVRPGQTIRWTNNDGVAHTVTAQSGARFDSGTMNAGATYRYTPRQRGTIRYFCTIHGQQQSGTITVR